MKCPNSQKVLFNSKKEIEPEPANFIKCDHCGATVSVVFRDFAKTKMMIQYHTTVKEKKAGNATR